MNVRLIWKAIDLWLQKNALAIYESLNQGATDEEITQAENEMRVKFPGDFKTSLKVHNGEFPDEGWIFSNWSLMPLNDILRQWRQECLRPSVPVSSDTYVKSHVWSPGWIPFAYDGSGGYLLVDLDPTDNGITGQVVRTSHDAGNARIAVSFHSFLEHYLQSLEDNVFVVEDECMEVASGKVFLFSS